MPGLGQGIWDIFPYILWNMVLKECTVVSTKMLDSLKKV